MQTYTQNLERCSGRIGHAWAQMAPVRASAAGARTPHIGSEPSLTVLSQQVSEAVVPPSAIACSLAGHGALSHLSGFSSELYLRDKQEQIDKEDACTEP